MVQVSTGDQSVNITEVGSAAVYYIQIICHNVEYCGLPPTSSGFTTYTSTYGVPAVWSQPSGSPLFMSGVSSQISSSESDSNSWESFRSSSMMLNAYSGSTAAYSANSFSATNGASDTANLSSIVGNPLFAGHELFSKQAEVAGMSCLPSAAAVEICGLGGYSSPYLVFRSAPTDPVGQDLGGIAVNQLEYSGLGQPSPGGLLVIPNQSSGSDGFKFTLGRGSSGDGQDSLYTVASLEQPREGLFHVVGISSGVGVSYPVVGLPSSIGEAATFGAYKSASGTDMESLSGQLAALDQNKMKIIGWSILYAPASDTEQTH